MSVSQRTTGVESARKVLRMLLRFSGDSPTATVEDLAREAGIPLSSAYRYVSLLREFGLIEEGDRGVYQVTSRIQPVADAADASTRLIAAARPVLLDVMRKSDETVVLVRLLGDVAVAVDQVESRQAVRLSFAPGRTMPLLGGAPAKLLLAYMPASTRAAYLDHIQAADPARASQRQKLDAELATIRRQGWAESFEEVDPGVWGAAAPVQRTGRTIAALSIAGPIHRLDGTARARVVGHAISGAREISERLG